ncbi:MAG: hypothetical protein ABEI31_00055, partial [Halodesulfurarchaeum sp.]
LVGLGWLLVSPRLAGSLGRLAPPILFSATADVAVFRDAVIMAELHPSLLARPVAVVLFLGGILLAERIRARYGIRTGLMAMALLSIYALTNAWLLVLYGLLIFLAYGVLELVHRLTLLYGRVLISVATTASLVAVVPVTLHLPITRGLSAYFVAILAGVNAYNWHVTAPSKRTLFVPLQVGAFLILLVTTQVVGLLRPDLIPLVFDLPVTLLWFVGSLACFGFVEYRSTDLPDEEAVFEASILSGGGEA